MVLISPTTNPIQNALTHTHFINQFWCLRIFVRCDQTLLDETAFYKQDFGPPAGPHRFMNAKTIQNPPQMHLF